MELYGDGCREITLLGQNVNSYADKISTATSEKPNGHGDFSCYAQASSILGVIAFHVLYDNLLITKHVFLLGTGI